MYENNDIFDISQPQYKNLREVLEILPDLIANNLKEALAQDHSWKNYSGGREAFLEDIDAAEDLKEIHAIIDDALKQISSKEPQHEEELDLHIQTIAFSNGFSLVRILSNWGLRREANYMTTKTNGGFLHSMFNSRNKILSSAVESSWKLGDTRHYYSIRDSQNTPVLTFIVNPENSETPKVYPLAPKLRPMRINDSLLKAQRPLIEKLREHLGKNTYINNLDRESANKPKIDLS